MDEIRLQQSEKKTVEQAHDPKRVSSLVSSFFLLDPKVVCSPAHNNPIRTIAFDGSSVNLS